MTYIILFDRFFFQIDSSAACLELYFAEKNDPNINVKTEEYLHLAPLQCIINYFQNTNDQQLDPFILNTAIF